MPPSFWWHLVPKWYYACIKNDEENGSRHEEEIRQDPSDAELKVRESLLYDLNVPQNKETLEVTDDTRIRGSVETLKYLASKGAKVMAASHLGRPKDGFEKKFSLEPVAPVLSKYLGQEVKLGKYYFLFVFSFHFFFLSYTKEFRIHTTHTISFVFIDLSHITL